MSMLFLLFVLCAATVGFFSQEILHAFKRFFSIPGAKLCAPLMFASLVVESYALWGYKGLSFLRKLLLTFEHSVSAHLPLQSAALMMTRAFLLTIIAMLPLWLVTVGMRKKRQPLNLYWAYCCSVVLWAGVVILLVT